MKLSELEPRFLKMTSNGSWRTDVAIEDCDGIIFLCPKCFVHNNGNVGTHSIICFKPYISRDITPGPGRWHISGSTFDDMSLTADSSSILLKSGCNAHFFIHNGNIVNI